MFHTWWILLPIMIYLYINPFPNMSQCLHVCIKSLLKTLWTKEKLLVTISPFPTVFSTLFETSQHFSWNSKLLYANLFQFGSVWNLCSKVLTNIHNWNLYSTVVPSGLHIFHFLKFFFQVTWQILCSRIFMSSELEVNEYLDIQVQEIIRVTS